MAPLFPHMRLFHLNTRKINEKTSAMTSRDLFSSAKSTHADESFKSDVCDTCNCAHGFSLFSHDDKVECALNQIKKLESQKPKMKVYPPIEELLPNMDLKTIIGFHKDDIDYWALEMCWRHRARVLMLHLEIAARMGDEEGIRRAKASFEEAGKVMEESIDETFGLMANNLEGIFQFLKWNSSRKPQLTENLEKAAPAEQVFEKEISAVDETTVAALRVAAPMNDCMKEMSKMKVTVEESKAVC